MLVYCKVISTLTLESLVRGDLAVWVLLKADSATGAHGRKLGKGISSAPIYIHL